MQSQFVTVKKFAFKKTTLTNGQTICWKFYYELREYEVHVDLEKYHAYENGDLLYRFPLNIFAGSFLYWTYKVVDRYSKTKKLI